MNKACCLVAVALLASACTSTRSTVTTAYYDIQARTAAQIDRGIRLNGPAGGHAIAAAEIRFVPVDVKQREDARGCSVAVARIRVEANIILPRWQNRSGAEAGLGRAFDNLAAYAKVHEQAHVDIANAAARVMEQRLKELPPQRSCAALEKRAAATVREVKARHDRAQRAFDESEKRRLRKLFAEAERKARQSS